MPNSIDAILEGLFTSPFSECAACMGVEADIENPGFMKLIYDLLKNYVLKPIGYVIFKIAEFFTLPADLLDALSSENPLGALSDIKDGLISAYNWLMDIITNTSNWIVENICDFYYNFPIPLGSVSISLPIDGFPSINIPLPANKLYNELDDNDWWKKYFDPSTIITWMTNFLSSSISYIFDIINKILEAISPIINLDVSKIQDAIDSISAFFVDLVNFIPTIIGFFLRKILQGFAWLSDKIDIAVTYLTNKITDFISGVSIDDLDIDIEYRGAWKVSKCVISTIVLIFSAILTYLQLT